LTVLENIILGLYSQTKSGILDGIFRSPRHRKERNESIQRAYEVLEFMKLNALANKLAESLSFVNKRWVEIARVIVGKPKLVIMDEPAAGLDASEISELVEIIYKMKNGGVTVLLIEHHLPIVMGISDEVVVLNFGKKIAEGSPKEVTTNKQVIVAYLGEEKNGST
jgi:branched-chain amino acid transport system ATP-binding protein